MQGHYVSAAVQGCTGKQGWCMTTSSSKCHLACHVISVCAAVQGCSGKKGVVYDYFFQYGPSVQLTNSDWWINFDSGFSSSITGQCSSSSLPVTITGNVRPLSTAIIWARCVNFGI